MVGLVALRRYKLYEPRNPRYRHSSPKSFSGGFETCYRRHMRIQNCRVSFT
jgi:hypothetical protein